MRQTILQLMGRRVEARLPKNLMVTIVGVTHSGEVFVEETQTENISRNGVCLPVSKKVTPGAKIGLIAREYAPGARAAIFEVRWTAEIPSPKRLVGASLIAGQHWTSLVNQITA